MQNNQEKTVAIENQSVFITPEELLEHWQGHRRVTRRVIEAFPEEKLFNYSIGGMRSFGTMAMEIINMGVPTLKGIVNGEWDRADDRESKLSKKEVLELWDKRTEQINTLLPQVSMEQFHKTLTAFGKWKMPVYELLFYVIDNEIHHRGQGYVYLRSLDVEPPLFPDRS